MPSVLDAIKCPSCGELHDLCFDEFLVPLLKRVEFTCPTTGKLTGLYPKKAVTEAKECPEGAVAAHVYQEPR